MGTIKAWVFEELSYYTAEKKAKPKSYMGLAAQRCGGESEKVTMKEERKQNGSLNQSPKRKGITTLCVVYDSLSETQDCTCRLYSLIQKREEK